MDGGSVVAVVRVIMPPPFPIHTHREKDQKNQYEWILDEMDLRHVLDRDIDMLSGGELQRFTIGIVVVQKSDVYMFDEPSSYLDVKQRYVCIYL